MATAYSPSFIAKNVNNKYVITCKEYSVMPSFLICLSFLERHFNQPKFKTRFCLSFVLACYVTGGPI